MSSSPRETLYGPFDNSAWVNIPCTMFGVRRMVIVEVPPQSGTPPVQGNNVPQGLSYQRWDPNLNNGLGDFGPTIYEALPDEEIPVGDGMTEVGHNAQVTVSSGGAKNRAADIPIRIRSGTSTTTQVRVREWNRGIAITS